MRHLLNFKCIASLWHLLNYRFIGNLWHLLSYRFIDSLLHLLNYRFIGSLWHLLDYRLSGNLWHLLNHKCIVSTILNWLKKWTFIIVETVCKFDIEILLKYKVLDNAILHWLNMEVRICKCGIYVNEDRNDSYCSSNYVDEPIHKYTNYKSIYLAAFKNCLFLQSRKN